MAQTSGRGLLSIEDIMSMKWWPQEDNVNQDGSNCVNRPMHSAHFIMSLIYIVEKNPGFTFMRTPQCPADACTFPPAATTPPLPLYPLFPYLPLPWSFRPLIVRKPFDDECPAKGHYHKLNLEITINCPLWLRFPLSKTQTPSTSILCT
jgi:hypothetical protein